MSDGAQQAHQYSTTPSAATTVTSGRHDGETQRQRMEQAPAVRPLKLRAFDERNSTARSTAVNGLTSPLDFPTPSSDILYPDSWPVPPTRQSVGASEKSPSATSPTSSSVALQTSSNRNPTERGPKQFRSIPNLQLKSSANGRVNRHGRTGSAANPSPIIDKVSEPATSEPTTPALTSGTTTPTRLDSLHPSHPIRSASLKKVRSKNLSTKPTRDAGALQTEESGDPESISRTTTATSNSVGPDGSDLRLTSTSISAESVNTRSVSSSTAPDKNDTDSQTRRQQHHFLRPATSIPDYSTFKGGYRATSVLSPPLASPKRGLHTQSAYTSTSPVNRRFPVVARDGSSQLFSPQQSTRSSAVTNGSSFLEGSGIERSSVRTERSSITDDGSTSHSVNPKTGAEEEMTAYDAISLYVDGFADDSGDEHPVTDLRRPPPLPSSLSTVITPASLSPGTEEPNANSPATPATLPRPFTANDAVTAVRSPTQLSGEHVDTSKSLHPRLNAFPSATRDRYGFKKVTQHIKVERYDAWNSMYTVYLDRRRRKWYDLMRHHGLPTENPVRFPPKSEKVKRYIRKGIPPEWRGAAWFWYADGPVYLARYPGLYDKLVLETETPKLSEGDREHIERDLYRTFPDNLKYKADLPPSQEPLSTTLAMMQVETPIIAALRRVLRAFALRNPHIGYCQSLNFLAGILLLFLDSEEKAFHLLCILTTKYLPGTHGVALEGANVDIGVLMSCIKEFMPGIWSKIDDRRDSPQGETRLSIGLPTVSLATTAWFMSCFVSTLPVETACRVWDCLWYEGSKTLFRVALTVFKIGEADIRRSRDMAEVFQVVQTLPRGLLDANLVMEIATRKGRGGMGALSQKMVERRRDDRRALYRGQKGTGGIPGPPAIPLDEQETSGAHGNGGGAGGVLKRSISRAAIKRLKPLKKSPS